MDHGYPWRDVAAASEVNSLMNTYLDGTNILNKEIEFGTIIDLDIFPLESNYHK